MLNDQPSRFGLGRALVVGFSLVLLIVVYQLMRKIMIGARWDSYDTWTVVTAALAAMACALPGVFLVLRRQSMMGDALAHTTLPGIVVAFLIAHWLEQSGWISSATYDSWRHAAMFIGALLIGVLSAVLTEWVQKLGRVEASAALGVVFTTLFAIGLLLIRLKADQVHIDPDCVLYGIIETTVMDTVPNTNIPRAAVVNGLVLLANSLLVVVFFKELRISAFDSAISTTMGINANVMHYALMAVTAATLVSAFESVGSILVIAMLIAPAATAHLLTDRLDYLIGISLAVAACSAFLGHLMAITLPSVIFTPLGYPEVVDTNTAGMMAVAAGCLFVTAALFGPRYGVVSKLLDQARLTRSIVAEDVLGLLYRLEEESGVGSLAINQLTAMIGTTTWPTYLALRGLAASGDVTVRGSVYELTDSGREKAKHLVRAHRLWESYMAKHFDLPADHLHESAALVEHFLGADLREELAAELDDTAEDPHGREIPPEKA
ncbi:MAG: metal ABC transporter permease [Planctomycetaceae bacterium]|nr:metal ABC transporter permease [Planctomycetales bacterium]MCB9872990.1 metal ABC transporter permease [Planctomycetaceae bacterium]MCB9937579.1 metal ABC transporter permease [Planctomycetaceae bacterium]